MNLEDRIKESKRWISQAENNLIVANELSKSGYYNWSCFISQQAAECALKAVYEYRGESIEKIHSLGILIQGDINENIKGIPELTNTIDHAHELDKVYIPTRYINSIPYGAPHEFFTRKDAEKCLLSAKEIVNSVKKLLSI